MASIYAIDLWITVHIAVLLVLMAVFLLWRNAKISLERRIMSKKTNITWHREPQEHDYPAAASYLSLTMGTQASKNVAKKLEHAEMTEFAAKDIFRASMLSLLGVSNSHVEKDRAKVYRHERLSPLLLFRDERNGKLVIADGYHRLCAVYTFDEDAVIPSKIV